MGETRVIRFEEQGPRIFEGYHYRTSSRFGGNVRISVSGDWVTVEGYRATRRARGIWLTVQGVFMVGLLGAIVDALFGRPGAWRRVGLFAFAEWLVAAFGALVVWWPAERGRNGVMWMVSDESGRAAGERDAEKAYSAVGFPRSAVTYAQVTPYYSRHGLWLVSWPWQAMTYLIGAQTHREVVLDVDDPARPGKKLVFAISMESEEDAKELVIALKG